MSQPDRSSPSMPANLIRKKAGGTKQWLLIDSTAQTQLLEADKHSIMQRTGLTARDLRILDPLLSYPTTILGRESAIIINLEHVKAIITAHDVLLLNSRDPTVAPFLEELQHRISRHYHAVKAQARNADNSGQSELQSPQNNSGDFLEINQEEEENADRNRGLECQDGSKILPFEFVALEACLEAVCSSFHTEARTLELEAHLALDKLTSKISTLNLERVRQIKSRLVTMTERVRKVKDELEELLDDDEDMAEMYLSKKLMQQLNDSPVSSVNERDDGIYDDEVLSSDLHERDSAEIPHPGSSQFVNTNDHLFNATYVPSRGSSGTHTTVGTVSKNLDVEELEMLLEAYFVQIDGTLNKLFTLRESVDDTEDYINIMLDDVQNHLLEIGVVLTTAALILSAFVTLTGILNMGINIKLFDEKYSGDRQFLWTVGGGTAGSIFLYVLFFAWFKRRRLIE